MEAGLISFADKVWIHTLNLGGQWPLIPSCASGRITFQLIHIVNLIAHWLVFINSMHCVVLVTCSKSPWLGQPGGKNSVDQRVEGWWTGCWFFQVDRLLFSSVSLCFRWCLPAGLRLPAYDRPESLLLIWKQGMTCRWCRWSTHC